MKRKDKTFRQYVGARGEDAAAGLLRDKGYNILRRNYAVHNVGELDIIAEKDGDIHIFEVRTRRNIGYYPDSAESVINSKRKKVMMTAERYIDENDLYGKNVVFEVIMVTHDEQGNIQRIDFVPF
ncbi:MAG: YraN family protein [Clostridiales bacterium]|nr:YraN family protein [Clostridiales bacterium]